MFEFISFSKNQLPVLHRVYVCIWGVQFEVQKITFAPTSSQVTCRSCKKVHALSIAEELTGEETGTWEIATLPQGHKAMLSIHSGCAKKYGCLKTGHDAVPS